MMARRYFSNVFRQIFTTVTRASQEESKFLQQKHEYERELLKKDLQLQLQLQLAENKCELRIAGNKLQYELKIANLVKDFSFANYENLKAFEHITIRSFIDLTDGEKMNGNIKYRRARFTKFAEVHSSKLEEWGIIQENFGDDLLKFYKKLCQTVHPQFKVGAEICIPKNFLSTQEWQILGFLWEVFPLPLSKLRMKNFQADESVSCLKCN